MKKIFAVLMSIAILGNGTILANTNSETIESKLNGHWSTPYMVSMYELGVFESMDDACNPTEQITRAELMRYINIMFNLIDTANVSFVDINSSMDCYEDVQKAVAHGYIVGDSTNSMRPNDTITRQETVVILSRLHKVEPATNLNFTFADASSIDSWAAPYVSDAVEKKYIVGNNYNEFNPKGLISRGEIAKVLYCFGGNIVETTNVTQSDLSDSVDNLTIRDENTTINVNGVNVTGDLFITAGTKNSTVVLTNVSVEGDIIIAGNDTVVELSGVTCDSLITSHDYQTISIDNTTKLTDILVYGDVRIEGEGTKSIVTKKDGVNIELNGAFGDLFVLNTSYINMIDTDLEKIYVIEGAEKSEITMENTVVKTANIQVSSSIIGGYIYEITVSTTGVVLDCGMTNFNMLMGSK